jgi:hypothetical protein
MPISFPITLPFSSKSACNIDFKPMVGAAAERSPFSGVENVQDTGLRLLQATIDLPPMKREAAAAAWVAALNSLEGPVGTFYLGDTAWKTPRGVGTGTPLINGANQTGEDLVTDGWTPSKTGILLAGDWIQIGTGGNSRLFMVVADANSDAGGNATLTIRPRLQYRTAFADNTPITVNNPVGVFRLMAPPGWTIDRTRLVKGLAFQAMEALNP